MSRRTVLLIALGLLLAGSVVAFFALRQRTPAEPVDRRFVNEAEATEPTGPSHTPYPFGKVLVVAVGIDRYPQLLGQDAELKAAEADAKAFAALCEDHFGYKTRTLLGPAADKAAVEQAVATAASELGPDDALVFFFAGHGQVVEQPKAGEVGYLVPVDAALDLKLTGRRLAWQEQAINVHELFARASLSQARHVLFVLDSCKSGIATGRGGATLDARSAHSVLRRSRAVLAAARRDQSAVELLNGTHGRFSKAVFDRLGTSEPASTLDLYQEVSKKVAHDTHGEAIPQFGQIEGDGMFVFIPRGVPREDLERDLKGVPTGPLAGVGQRATTAFGQLTTEAELHEAFFATDYRGTPDAAEREAAWEEKFHRFRRNAGVGDVRAMAALSLCYAKGLGTTADPEFAHEWAKHASRIATPAGVGKWSLGQFLLETVLDRRNPAAGEKLLVEAAAEYPLAKLSLARYWIRRRPERGKEIRTLLSDAAAAGLREAELDLADLLLDGPVEGRAEAVAEAERIYRKAAEAKLPRGDFGLFRLYAEGRKGYPTRDAAKAERHLRAAADAGLPDAIYHLGLALWNDPGKFTHLRLERHNRNARELIDRAAQMNHPPALVASCQMLLLGVGGPVDDKLAIRRLDAAMALDHGPAFTLKGVFYQSGQFFPVDEAKAFDCFEKATARSDPEGVARLARGYLTGLNGIKRDLREFHFNGQSHAVGHWAIIALQLDPEKLNPDVQEITEYLLDELKRGYARERAGDDLPDDAKSLRPSRVFANWKKEYPDTFADFCKRFRVKCDPK